MKTLKKPCVICGRWFTPDPRTRTRQGACFDEFCRLKQRQATQRRWRDRNPSYFSERRLRTRAERSAELVHPSHLPPPSPLPSPLPVSRPPVPALERIPWEYVREVFGPAGETLLAYLLAQVLQAAKAERQLEVNEMSGESRREPERVQTTQSGCQDETWGQVFEKSVEMDTLQDALPIRSPPGQDERLI